MKRLILILVPIILGVALACGGGTQNITTSPTVNTTASSSTPTSTPLVPTPTASSEFPAITPQAFYLEVLSPEDESILGEASVEVRGRTVPDAVVTVSGQVVEVSATGDFFYVVELEEGPNYIEVVASDFQGNQDSRVITVIYVA